MMDKYKLLDWFVWVMIGVTAILFILKVFGNSPTMEQLLLSGALTFLALFYKDLQDTKSNSSKNFQEIKERLGEHSVRLEQLAEIKRELKNHKHGEKK